MTGAAAEPVTVAAFDFDGTLTRGGSVFPFLVAVRGTMPVLRAVLRGLPSLVRGGILSGSDADRAKEELFTRLLAGLPADRVEAIGREFAERHLRLRLRADTRDRLDWHRKQGHRVVLVSASPEVYVQVAAEILGADGAVATRLQVGGGGLLTGRYEGKNTRGSEKYARVVGWLRSAGLVGNGGLQPELWAYGNSRGDLRLLQAADHGVNAGRLGRLGRLGRFPTLAQVTAAAPS
ncbi:MAG: HAD-IB family hydrolase [Acidimicrobiales bacterium]